MTPETDLSSSFPQQPLRSRRKLPWQLVLLLTYLAAITIFGKGPTYIGIEPLFWGEIVLVVSVIWAARRSGRLTAKTARARAVTSLILCFIGVGAIETARDVVVFGLDALRDAAVWYYSVFYFVGIAIASNREECARFLSRWKLFWLVAVPWGIAEFASGYRFSALSPALPGSRGIPVLSHSSSDIAQSLGLGCLLLVSENVGPGFLGKIPRIILAVVGFGALATFQGRGARLAVVAAFVVLVLVSVSQRSMGRIFRRRIAATALLLIAGVVVAMGEGVDVARILSLDRFLQVTTSTLEGTAEWRAAWWRGIYDAVMETNPAFGLGFGDNLNSYNPYISPSDDNHPARAPHNYNVTVFARMGIGGSVIWAGILFFGIFVPLWETLTSATVTAQAEAKHRLFWIAAIIAIWVNSSFGLLMEGPVMGIPFWLILGLLSMRPPQNLQLFSRCPVENFYLNELTENS